MFQIYNLSLLHGREKELLHNLEYGVDKTAPRTINSIQFAGDSAGWAGARELIIPIFSGEKHALCLQCRPNPEKRDEGSITVIGVADAGEWDA